MGNNDYWYHQTDKLSARIRELEEENARLKVLAGDALKHEAVSNALPGNWDLENIKTITGKLESSGWSFSA